MAISVHPNGDIKYFPLEPNFRDRRIQFTKLLECDCLDYRSLAGVQHMVVDDDGHAKNLAYNETASYIYQIRTGSPAPIVGMAIFYSPNEIPQDQR